MQQAVRDILALTSVLRDDTEFAIIEQAVPILDRLTTPIEADDLKALISLLPANGDTAHGLNWTILHAIESSSEWPLWELLADTRNEWVQILKMRLENGGCQQP